MYRQKKTSDLRKMSSEQLKERLVQIGNTQMLLRGQKENKLAVNPGQWKNIKKEKARILTILGERTNP